MSRVWIFTEDIRRLSQERISALLANSTAMSKKVQLAFKSAQNIEDYIINDEGSGRQSRKRQKIEQDISDNEDAMDDQSVRLPSHTACFLERMTLDAHSILPQMPTPAPTPRSQPPLTARDPPPLKISPDFLADMERMRSDLAQARAEVERTSFLLEEERAESRVLAEQRDAVKQRLEEEVGRLSRELAAAGETSTRDKLQLQLRQSADAAESALVQAKSDLMSSQMKLDQERENSRRLEQRVSRLAGRLDVVKTELATSTATCKDLDETIAELAPLVIDGRGTIHGDDEPALFWPSSKLSKEDRATVRTPSSSSVSTTSCAQRLTAAFSLLQFDSLLRQIGAKKHDVAASFTHFSSREFGPLQLHHLSPVAQKDPSKGWMTVLCNYTSFSAPFKLYAKLYSLFLSPAQRTVFLGATETFRKNIKRWSNEHPWDCIMDYFVLRGAWSLTCPLRRGCGD